MVSDPHNLAWTFNIRGGDVAHTPLPLGYAVIPREGRPTVFLDPAKVTNEAGAAIGDVAEVAPAETLPARSRSARPAAKVRIDADERRRRPSPAHRERGRGGRYRSRPDHAHEGGQERRRDRGHARGASEGRRRRGAVSGLARRARRLAARSPRSRPSRSLRRSGPRRGLLKDISFPTISGSGPNGAIVHYRVTRRTTEPSGPVNCS